MRCSSFSAKNLAKMSFPLISQRKMDGLYCDIIVTNDKVEYRTRNGGFLDFNTDEMDEDLKAKYQDKVIMCEGVALEEDKVTLMERSASNGYMNSDDIDPERVCFYVWDIVPIEDFKKRKCTIPYTERFKELTDTIVGDNPKLKIVDTILCSNVEDVLEHFKENRLGGHEGTVIKNLDTIWKHGTSTNQIKIKVVFECELKVIGYKPGTNKYEGQIGSLQFTSSDGLVNVYVGSGLTDEQRVSLMDEIEFLISKEAIATIKANDVTKTTDKDGNVEYSLFLARFKNWRIDKDEADSLERIQEQVKSFTDALKLIKVDV
jgi:ATP-dependent DNA ligase